MSGHAPVRLLVNPAAGRGHALRRLDAARHALARAGPFDIVTTTQSGDEAQLARDATRDGVRVLVVLGGDGTVSRVAAALVGARSSTALAIFGAGTGNDLAKTLGAPVFDFAAMTSRILRNEPRLIDVGVVDDRVFVNAVGVGFDVSVLEQTARARWLRGSALYAVTALGQLFRFRGVEVGIETPAGTSAGTPAEAPYGSAVSSRENGEPTPTIRRGRWLAIVVANGQWFGGAFRIAPVASVTDGALDLVAIGDASPFRRVQLFAGAPWGRHVQAKEVVHAQHHQVLLHFSTPPQYQADGELYQARSNLLSISVMERALRVIG